MRLRNRQWGVWIDNGGGSKPVRFVACVRANAKSIARGIVSRSRIPHIPKSRLVVVEGCGGHPEGFAFRGARRRRRR
jgi:hypothetical protein